MGSLDRKDNYQRDVLLVNGFLFLRKLGFASFDEVEITNSSLSLLLDSIRHIIPLLA